MWKKAKKRAIPSPPNHAAGFRELPPPTGIIAIEVEFGFADPVLFPFAVTVLFEYPPGVIEGGVGTDFEVVEVDFIGIVG